MYSLVLSVPTHFPSGVYTQAHEASENYIHQRHASGSQGLGLEQGAACHPSDPH